MSNVIVIITFVKINCFQKKIANIYSAVHPLFAHVYKDLASNGMATDDAFKPETRSKIHGKIFIIVFHPLAPLPTLAIHASVSMF